MSKSINIDETVLKILESTGTEVSILKDLEKINSERYTLMYTSKDHEICYEQVDTIEQINKRLKNDTEDHESGWELEHIFHKGKPLKYTVKKIIEVNIINE